MKVAVLIPAHCAPEILFLTVGSWLLVRESGYEASLFVGLHSTYHIYHDGLPDIWRTFDGYAKLCFVDEVPWKKLGFMRYSRMHARSILNMMKHVPPDVTHVAVLDHDLLFQSDFVGWSMMQNHDLTCSLHRDIDEVRDVKTHYLGIKKFAPKPSAWRLTLSKRMADQCLANPEAVLPTGEDDLIYDTFAIALERARGEWGMDVGIYPESRMNDMAQHNWKMSFNYGSKCEGVEAYNRKVQELVAVYRKMFPDGIRELLPRMKDG